MGLGIYTNIYIHARKRFPKVERLTIYTRQKDNISSSDAIFKYILKREKTLARTKPDSPS